MRCPPYEDTPIILSLAPTDQARGFMQNAQLLKKLKAIFCAILLVDFSRISWYNMGVKRRGERLTVRHICDSTSVEHPPRDWRANPLIPLESLVVGGGQVLKTLPLLPWVIVRQPEAGNPLEPAPIAATFFTRRSVWWQRITTPLSGCSPAGQASRICDFYKICTFFVAKLCAK